MNKSPKFYRIGNKDVYSMNEVAEVLPGLLMGSQYLTSDVNMLKTHRVSHILSIGQHALSQSVPGIKYSYFEVEDSPQSDIKKISEECTKIIDQERAAGGVVYVHCNAGVSRSAAVVIAYLMTKERISYEQAYDRLKKVRSCIQPNEGFVKQLKLLEKELSSGRNSVCNFVQIKSA